jgi:hypothetical protein
LTIIVYVGEVALNNNMKAYTYLLKFKPTNKFYYGVRVKTIKLNRDPEDDLMVRYTTSSENINNLIAEHGIDAFEWSVRKTFNTAEEAITWETKVLRRSKVLERQDIWLNGNVAGYKITTEAGRKKIRETHMGKAKTEEHKQKIREAQKGKPKKSTAYKTQEYREKMSKAKSGENNGRYGMEVSQETRDRISQANKGRPPSNKGKPMSEEQKSKIRATLAAKKNVRVQS